MGVDTEVVRLSEVEAAYGRTTVLRDIDLTIRQGSVVGLLGANGAGKTTLLRVVAGLLRPRAGQILLDGQDVTTTAPHLRNRAGVCLIPEGRGIFRSLTVRENLVLFLPRHASPRDDIEAGVEAFPILGKRLSQTAGSLSGGEQQMLAVAKAFLTRPKVVLADELSLGLAPKIIDEIYASLRTLRDEGITLLIVEQYVHRILEFADDINVLSRGRVSWAGAASEIDEESSLTKYLGDQEVEVLSGARGPE